MIDAPQFVEVERALTRRGLKDPWLRNDGWCYNVKQFVTHRSRLILLLFKGFPQGFAAFVTTIGVEFALRVDYPTTWGSPVFETVFELDFPISIRMCTLFLFYFSN